MILSDRDILQRANDNIKALGLKIDPFTLKQLQPSSYDLRLSPYFWKMEDGAIDTANLDTEAMQALVIDLTDSSSVLGNHITDSNMIIRPNEFILGSTIERVQIPIDLVARLEGKSSLGRLGLIVHATAGFVDPGFSGHLTLELCNLSSRPIRMYHNMLIAQITFIQMSSPSQNPYGHFSLHSRYQHQSMTPVPYRPSQSEKP